MFDRSNGTRPPPVRRNHSQGVNVGMRAQAPSANLLRGGVSGRHQPLRCSGLVLWLISGIQLFCNSKSSPIELFRRFSPGRSTASGPCESPHGSARTATASHTSRRISAVPAANSSSSGNARLAARLHILHHEHRRAIRQLVCVVEAARYKRMIQLCECPLLTCKAVPARRLKATRPAGL